MNVWSAIGQLIQQLSNTPTNGNVGYRLQLYSQAYGNIYEATDFQEWSKPTKSSDPVQVTKTKSMAWFHLY